MPHRRKRTRRIRVRRHTWVDRRAYSPRFRREVRAPFPPAWIVRPLLAPLAALARSRGHSKRYGTLRSATA